MKKTALLLGLVAAIGSAQAIELPNPSPYDTRIKTVTYNAQDVVRINGMVGIATHIQLEPGERYVDHAFGDSQGWHFSENGNHIFLKPAAENSDTNLVLITDRRVYNFELDYADANRRADKMFSVTFKYPEVQTRANAAAYEAAKIKQGFNMPRTINSNYTMTGDLSIAPINAWDNGQFTFFRFPGAVDVPAVYVVEPDGTESIVNQNVQGAASDTLVMHKTGAQWVLRLGKSSLSVFNESYDPNGVSNTSRTASPEVIRGVRGGEE